MPISFAPDPAHLLLPQRDEIAALPEDLAGDDLPRRHRDQLQHGECGDGLAATGFADNPESFAAINGEIDAVDGVQPSPSSVAKCVFSPRISSRCSTR